MTSVSLVSSWSWAQEQPVGALEGNGELTWTCPEPDLTYRVEWAATLEGPWSASWAELSQVAPGAADEVTVPVPMFYRVRTPALIQTVETKSATEAGEIIRNMGGDADFVILDVRTVSEYGSGHIVGSVTIDFYSPTFDAILALLPRDRTYLVYCRSGGRSGSVVSRMRLLGFETVYDLAGGFTAFSAVTENADLIE